MAQKPTDKRSGFTLIEVVLVLVIIVIVAGISVPYFGGSIGASKLRSAGRSISHLAQFSRSMAIMRQQTIIMVIDKETMEIYAGPMQESNASEADGAIDQEILQRLGYVDREDSEQFSVEQKLMARRLPEGVSIRRFEKDLTDLDDSSPNSYIVQCYPNGQCEWFELELENRRGSVIKIENDPISGKISSENL